MNKARREKLSDLLEQINGVQEALREVLEEEEDCLNNMPENLQGSERYENMENAVSSMEDALSGLEEAESSLEEAIG